MDFDLQLAIRLGETITALYSGALAPTIVDIRTDTQVRVDQVYAAPGLPWQDGEFVISAPGTDSLRDWLSDIRVLKVSDGYGAKVHRGFHQAFAAVIEQVAVALPSNATITLTGHSLGAAVITRIARELRRRGFGRIRNVYLFGCPRVGNGAWARDYNRALGAHTFRIVNARDPVPWLPLPLPILRSGIYTHTDRLVYLPRAGGVEIDETVLKHLPDALTAWQDRTEEQRFFGDILTARCHQMTSYLTKLKQLT